MRLMLTRPSLAVLVSAVAVGFGLPAAAQPAAQPAEAQQAAPAAETPAETPTPGIALPFGLTLTGSAATTNNYLFRGISQTRNNWAIQGSADLQHESGVYVGAFASNAKFLADPTNTTRQELDILVGYRVTLADINFDIGYIAYTYPGQTKPAGTQLNEFQEIMVKANTTIDIVKLLGTVAYSPNFFGRSGTGWYIEGGLDVTLPLEVTAFGRVGYQWIQNNPRFGTPDYLWYGVGIQRPVWGPFTAALGWYGTNISKGECAPNARATIGQGICDGRVLFTLTAAF
jgi:uncharacterized protein (TIGR02001 family)